MNEAQNRSTNSGVSRGTASASELEIEYRPLERLIPYVRNARTHSDAQVAQIAASIREFGWTNPILVDGDSGVIAGHGRLLAARQLGLASVPVIELTGLSEAQKRAYVPADTIAGSPVPDPTSCRVLRPEAPPISRSGRCACCPGARPGPRSSGRAESGRGGHDR